MCRMIRPCTDGDFDKMFEVINDGATAYRGVISDDCWSEPYMPAPELRDEIAAGVKFWGIFQDDQLAAVMGIQDVKDVALIRHAYTRTGQQGKGLGLMAGIDDCDFGAGAPREETSGRYRPGYGDAHTQRAAGRRPLQLAGDCVRTAEQPRQPAEIERYIAGTVDFIARREFGGDLDEHFARAGVRSVESAEHLRPHALVHAGAVGTLQRWRLGDRVVDAQPDGPGDRRLSDLLDSPVDVLTGDAGAPYLALGFGEEMPHVPGRP